MNFPKLPVLFLLFLSACIPQRQSIHQLQSEEQAGKPSPVVNEVPVQTGLEVLLSTRLADIRGKRIGLVTNQSGIDRNGQANYRLLLDSAGVDLKVVFSPEHGLFGEAAAGEKVEYEEKKTNLPKLVSLYGKNRKPRPEQLKDLDLILYDIQDIGARYYTYISTLGLMMEAAGEAGIPVLVLDRPNPITGTAVEGPLLQLEFRSFVGYYPIPARYGLTVGELARMIVGEKWIETPPALSVIPVKGWRRSLWLDETSLLWIKPSPNIPDLATATVYPGTCYLEATNVSEGRGTPHPFRWFGAPWIKRQELAIALNNLNLPGVVFKPITFTPVPIPGAALHPKFENQECHGVEIIVLDRIRYESVTTGVMILSVLRGLYPDQIQFRESSLKRLWGSNELFNLLQEGGSVKALLEKSKTEAEAFQNFSRQYYLY
jgi:uncharacterized protein YbbC (DUF1343 family)